jgi:alkylhydroperoxidase family enzyme
MRRVVPAADAVRIDCQTIMGKSMSNTPIKRIPREALRDDHKLLWDIMNRLTGDPTSIEVLAHSPATVDWYHHEFYAKLFANQYPGLFVDVRFKHLLRLRLSKQHGCALCNRGNEEQAREIGFSDAQIDALIETTPSRELFTEAEHTVIEFANQMLLHNMEGRLTSDLYARMRAHFSDAQVVEIAVVASVLVGAAKMRFVLDIVPRDANCPFPAASESRAQAAA